MLRQTMTWIGLTGVLVMSSCAQPPAAPAAPPAPLADAPDDIAGIHAARAAFVAAYAAGDADAIGRLYAADAISEPNNQATLTGRDAIVRSLQGMFTQMAVKVDLQTDETRTLGSVGFDRGRYTVTVTPKAGAPPTSAEGRYMVIFVKEPDGAWRVWRDIDNAMAAAAQTATAAK